MKKISIKDRIVEFIRVPVSELMDNAGNWRTHPEMQGETLKGLLKEVGITGAVLAYHSKRNKGKLTLIDGHLRKEVGEKYSPDLIWPVLVVDLTDEEADFLLAVYDPVGAMAEMDKKAMALLIDNVSSSDWAVRELLRDLEKKTQEDLRDANKKKEDEESKEETSYPDMEILPLDNLDYILVMFKNEMDWVAVSELLELHKCQDLRRTSKVGLSRVLDGGRILSEFIKAEGSSNVN